MKETRYIPYVAAEEHILMSEEAFLSWEEACRGLEALLQEDSDHYGVEYKEESAEEREEFEGTMCLRGVWNWDIKEVLF